VPPKPTKPPCAGDKGGEGVSITFNDILGTSKAIERTIDLAKRFANTDESILLTGESGTGKEYFAQAIHNHSRPHGPFMSINCAAIPHRLIESELFGYEGGAFTGAQRGGKPGKIELANGGTLFLDEIGDMPLGLQATLLRVLENRRVMRIGAKSYKQVDFRVVAATNRDLMALVANGSFREDLFYRLSILTLVLPPLRERQEDLEYFIHRFLEQARRKDEHKGKGEPRRLSAKALAVLKAYPWPGNVRQLKNALLSAYHAAPAEVIDISDLPGYLAAAPATPKAAPTPTDHFGKAGAVTLPDLEDIAIKAALEQTGYNVAKAAKQLGISKATLYRKLKESRK
jgi:transcriptional regulator with PAS, ATPase and Fis domain